MRESRGALARIARQAEGQTQWLVRWNHKWESFSLIGGHLEQDETYRECLLREIEEEIGLTEDALVASGDPAVELSYVAFSKRANADTQYVLLLYDVDIPECTTDALVASDERLRWVSLSEIRDGCTADGKAVADVVKRFYAVTAVDTPNERRRAAGPQPTNSNAPHANA